MEIPDENYRTDKEEDDSIIDEESQRVINGEPLYWTTTQVGEKLEETDSTIRYWCIEFAEFLNIETTGKSGKKRLFKANDIKKLEYIKKLLKQEKFSIRQVKEYLATAEGEAMLPIEKAKEYLVIEAVSKVVAKEMDKRLDERFATLQSMIGKVFAVQSQAHMNYMDDLKTELLKEQELMKAEICSEQKKFTSEISAQLEQLAQKIDAKNKNEQKIQERELKFMEFMEEFRHRQKEPVQKTGLLAKLFRKKER